MLSKGCLGEWRWLYSTKRIAHALQQPPLASCKHLSVKTPSIAGLEMALTGMKQACAWCGWHPTGGWWVRGQKTAHAAKFGLQSRAPLTNSFFLSWGTPQLDP